MKESARLGIVVSRFNEPVTGLMKKLVKERLQTIGIENHIWVDVSGVVEIPLIAKKMASCNHYDAVIALGCVIRGETDHYDYVCNQVSYGCQKVAIEEEIPVIFGILTVDNKEQALDRLGGEKGDRAGETVDIALEMVEICKQFH